MASTTNYNWSTPDDTALVKDGAAAIRTLGSSIDTTTKALNPSTTLGDIEYRSATANTNTRLPIGTNGQVLSISGGVPAWATTADQTPLTTKGDIFTFTTVDARLGVGANGTVLTADSAEASGLKWATPAGGGKVLQVVYGSTTTSTSVNSTSYTDISLSASITPTLSTSKVLILANVQFYLDINGQSKAMGTRLLRNSTAIFTDDTGLSSGVTAIGASAVGQYNRVPVNYLDSPSTTSSTTYKIQGKASTATGSLNFQEGSAPSSIILMEIGA
jgi:hypothetical protein